MDWRPLTATLAVLTTVVLAGPARALDIDLEYDAPPSRAAGGLPVAVTFENARPADEGGNDISRICTVRSLAGIPWELHTASEHVDTVVPRYVADALRAAGFDARVGSDPALPTVHVVLDEMWCSGHVHYETFIKATLKVFPVGAAVPAWEERFAVQEGVTLNWGFQEMAEGFERAFHTGLPMLDALFTSAGFRQALQGAPTAVAAAPPPVASAPAGPLPGEDSAADIVGLYYVFQGTTAQPQQLADGVAAAMGLFREGISEEALRKAVVRVHQEIPGARTAAFEVIVPPYARADAADLSSGGTTAPAVAAVPTPVREDPVVVADPTPVVADPTPVVAVDPEMPDVLLDPEMPDVLPDPEAVVEPTPVEEDVVVAPRRDDPEPDSVASSREPVQARGGAATVRGPRKPIPRGARLAMGFGGAALVAGGMVGGVAIAVSCSNASGYDQHGGIPALGLIPLAGPAIVHGYWLSYGTYRYVQPYGGPAALMTALEITGVALIVVAVALPKAPPGVAVRRTPLRDVVVVPSFGRGFGGWQLSGRF